MPSKKSVAAPRPAPNPASRAAQGRAEEATSSAPPAAAPTAPASDHPLIIRSGSSITPAHQILAVCAVRQVDLDAATLSTYVADFATVFRRHAQQVPDENQVWLSACDPRIGAALSTLSDDAAAARARAFDSGRVVVRDSRRDLVARFRHRLASVDRLTRPGTAAFGCPLTILVFGPARSQEPFARCVATYQSLAGQLPDANAVTAPVSSSSSRAFPLEGVMRCFNSSSSINSSSNSSVQPDGPRASTAKTRARASAAAVSNNNSNNREGNQGGHGNANSGNVHHNRVNNADANHDANHANRINANANTNANNQPETTTPITVPLPPGSAIRFVGTPRDMLRARVFKAAMERYGELVRQDRGAYPFAATSAAFVAGIEVVRAAAHVAEEAAAQADADAAAAPAYGPSPWHGMARRQHELRASQQEQRVAHYQQRMARNHQRMANQHQRAQQWQQWQYQEQQQRGNNLVPQPV